MKKLLLFAACLGLASTALAQIASTADTISGRITANATWLNNKVHYLDGYVFVTNGATLTIQPGTVIKGIKASKGTLLLPGVQK